MTLRALRWSLLAACAAGTPSALTAQMPPVASRNVSESRGTFASAQNRDASITVSLSNVPLETALRAIAEQAGLRLLFRDDSALRTHVSVKVRGARLSDALRIATAGTAAHVEVMPSGMLVVTVETPAERDARVQGTIQGRVVEAETRQAIRGATLTLDDGRSTTTTDDGAFRFTGVEPGQHSLSVRRLGFAPATRRVTLGDGATATLTIELSTAANTLDQVVVTGTVVATELKAVPNAMTVMTSDQLEQRGATSLDQIFRGEVPGVFEQSRGDAGTSTNGYGLTYMVSRGVTTIGSTGVAATQPVKTYVDGVEVAYPWYLASIDPRTIDRLEFIPGPQASTIYGSGALGGVLQVFTKRGTAGTPTYALSLSSGAVQSNYNNSLPPKFDANGQFAGGDRSGFSYAGGGGWQSTGEWLPGLYRRDANGYVNGSYSGIRNVTADISLRLSNRSLGSSNYTYQSALERSGDFYYIPGDLAPVTGHAAVKTQTAGLTLGWKPQTWWEHRLVLGNDDIGQGSFRDTPTYTTPADSLKVITTINSHKQTLQYSTTLKHDLATRIAGTFTAGADVMSYESVLSLANTPQLTGVLSGGAASPPFIQRTTENNRGAFGQAQIGFADQLFITGGLRAEHNSNYGTSLPVTYAPRIGGSLVHYFGDIAAKARIAYGKSTRAPSSGLRDAVYLTNATYGTYQSQIANRDLGPEYQAGTEMGVELYSGSRARLQITHYDQTVDNLIVSVPVDSVRSINPNTAGNYIYAAVVQRRNVGSVRNQGWEGQGMVQLLRGVSVGGTLSNSMSRIRRLSPAYSCNPSSITGSLCLSPGKGLFNVAEHTGAAYVSYAGARLSGQLTVSHIGERQFAYDYETWYATTYDRLNRQSGVVYTPVTAPGYNTADLRAAFRVTDRTQLFLNMTNLTNSAEGDYTGRRFLPVIGRATMLGLRITGP
jgi:outer membrane receptor protein involved in Fe transport